MWIRTFCLAAMGTLPVLAPAQDPAETAPPAAKEAKEEARSVSPPQAREVIERLKTMRAQLLLEQEYNRLLEARVAREELEAKLVGGKAPAAKAGVKSKVGGIAPPPKLEAASDQLVVKMVTTAPFKEAIVVYKQRVYTVRPGDNLGDCQIRDINEGGVVTSGCGTGRASLPSGP